MLEVFTQQIIYDPALVEAFAAAIAEPGTNAMLIGSDNQKIGEAPIDKAALMGCAFAVEVMPDILAVDCDSRPAADYAVDLISSLRAISIKAIVVGSGRTDHAHLFARVPDAETLGRLKHQAHAHAEGREVRRWMRPPLSPHRLGPEHAPRLIVPATPAEALALLTRGRRIARPLKPPLAALLKYGVPKGGRSEAIMKIANGAVNSAWSFSAFAEAMLDRRNRGGEKVQELQHRAAMDYLARTWRNAETWIAERPAVATGSDAIALVAAMRAAADRCTWTGRAGATDRAVLDAHTLKAERFGIVHGASVRQISEATLLPVAAVIRSHKRLRRAGWLRIIAEPRDGRGMEWRLAIPRDLQLGDPRDLIPLSAGDADHQNSLDRPIIRCQSQTGGTGGRSVLSGSLNTSWGCEEVIH